MGIFQKSKSMENIVCLGMHTINGEVPTVDPKKIQIQNEDLIEKPCDCGKLLYNEGRCHCPNKREWEIRWEPNPNY